MMKKSEFLSRVGNALVRLTNEYNHNDTDKKSFDWQSRSVYYSKVVNLFFPIPGTQDSETPVVIAIRNLAYRKVTGSNADLENISELERAWESYKEAQNTGGGIVEIP